MTAMLEARRCAPCQRATEEWAHMYCVGWVDDATPCECTCMIATHTRELWKEETT